MHQEFRVPIIIILRKCSVSLLGGKYEMIKNGYIDDANNRIKKSYRSVFLLILIISFSIFTAVLIGFDQTRPSNYNFLWMLPLTFSLICFPLVSYTRILFHRISVFLVFSLYFIRMVISPLSMFWGNYGSYGYGYFVDTYSGMAIILMSYEAVMVFAFIIINSKKLKNNNILPIQTKNSTKVKRTKLPFLFKLALGSLLAYIVMLVVSNPSLIRSNFVFLIGTPNSWVLKQEYASINGSGSGTLGILVTLMNTVFWLLQALLPPVILLKIAQKKSSFYHKFVLSLILLSLVLLIATETRASSVESAIALIIVMSLVFGQKFSKKIPLMMLIIGVVVVVGLFSKSSVGFNFEDLSKTLTAYFSGPQNVAISIGVAKEYSELNLFMLPVDIALKIPYLSSFFKSIFSYSSNDYFNTVFANLYGRNIGQIIPAIGQGYVYFGFILSPIIPCLAVAIAMKFEKKARSEANIVFKYIFYLAAIMMSRATIISNMLSGIGYMFNIFLAYVVASLTMKYITVRKMKNQEVLLIK